MKAAFVQVLWLLALSACDPYAYFLRHAPSQLVETGRAVGCQQPRSLLAADIDGDGHMDLAFLAKSASSKNFGVRVLWGDGMGGLEDNKAWYELGEVDINRDPTQALAVIDLNQDGNRDLVALTWGTKEQAKVWSLVKTGGRTFIAAQSLAFSVVCPLVAPENLFTVVAADLEQDGQSELILGFEQGTGTPSQQPPCFLRYDRGDLNLLYSENTVGSYPSNSSYGIFVSNILVNGTRDVYITKTNSTSAWRLTINKDTGKYSRTEWASLPMDTLATTVALFNGDTYDDLLYTTNSGLPNIWTVLGDTPTPLRAQPGTADSIGISSRSATVGDLDHDGNLDIVILRTGRLNNPVDLGTSSPLLVLMGRGQGTFDPVDNYQSDEAPQDLVSADFNHDGFADIALTVRGSQAVVILSSTGPGMPASSLRHPPPLDVGCP
ncbi:MAG: VCBS repeat-containing protein [Myxococcales bacterium]|nr:VCBS repeat-containing protein [Myxococcales bacterium]